MALATTDGFGTLWTVVAGTERSCSFMAAFSVVNSRILVVVAAFSAAKTEAVVFTSFSIRLTVSEFAAEVFALACDFQPIHASAMAIIPLNKICHVASEITGFDAGILLMTSATMSATELVSINR